MKVMFRTGRKAVFRKSVKIVAIHKSFRRVVKSIRRESSRFASSASRIGRQREKAFKRQFTRKSLEARARVGIAVVGGFAVGGPVGAAAAGAAAIAQEVERGRAEKAFKKGEQQEILFEAELTKQAKAAGIKAKAKAEATRKTEAETAAAAAAKLVVKRKRAGRTALITTTPQGILGEPLTGRRRLTT